MNVTAYLLAILIIAGAILYIVLAAAALMWGLDTDHPILGCIPIMPLFAFILLYLVNDLAQALVEAGVGA
ncbi:hypothetical protein [Bifidobacterium samirii]|uniref:Uncharacterized protein n=1 Tax=Bifidobacterium samirii TaxID=2306974 RepID=A0A430FJI7_9BIFI|nr:hypothetical protein [Bifidobacterium samirii]RSX52996.1 hypothetical protein D2E24_1667 [Bifidobacterium samirii]